MPTYAILGVTGQTGREILKALLPTDNHLNLYARSRERLEDQFPSISSAPNVTLFIGDLSDTSLLSSCLAGADIILSTVAQNQNEPRCSIAQRTAMSIVQALAPYRSPVEGKPCPTPVFLASASLHPANTAITKLPASLLYWTLHHVYDDLKAAIKLLEANPWIPLVIASPGALIHGSVHDVELTEDLHHASDLLSYADLAKGMIAMGASEGGDWRGKHVAMRVNNGEQIKGNPAALLRYLLPNLLGSLCPPLWRLGRNWWPK